MAESCGVIGENNRNDGLKYICQKDKGHKGHHVFTWREKGKIHIDGIEQDEFIDLMTWW